MIAKLKSGKIINGRLADTFVNLGIAVEVKTKTDEPKNLDISVNLDKQVKRIRRTKAEIEADKKNT